MMGGNGSKSACYMNFFAMDVMPNCSTCRYLDGQHHTCVNEQAASPRHYSRSLLLNLDGINAV
jgi:hypothetical protein